MLNSSGYFAYVGLSNNVSTTDWFKVPGIIASGATRNFGEYSSWSTTQGTVSGVIIRRESLGTSGAMTATVRIIIIPANDLRNGRKAAVDFNDYNAVKEYYGLKD